MQVYVNLVRHNIIHGNKELHRSKVGSQTHLFV